MFFSKDKAAKKATQEAADDLKSKLKDTVERRKATLKRLREGLQNVTQSYEPESSKR